MSAIPDATVLISTYNRSDALRATLEALAAQDVPADAYEVVVVDDGSTDDTAALLSAARLGCRLRTVVLERNRGVAAGRNAGIRLGGGRHLILLSDDMLVSPSFIARVTETLDAHPGTWIGGAFEQLPALRATAFGRYLDGLERGFDAARQGRPLPGGLVELRSPSARCLALPRADLERIGLFDERFRVTCEDQDLCRRAAREGIRFALDPTISCLHNDASAEIARYCRFQRLGAADTARLVRKYPELDGGAEIVRINGRPVAGDDPGLVATKLIKRLGSADAPLRLATDSVMALERTGAGDRVLFWAYRKLIALYTYRGWSEGGAPTAARTGTAIARSS
jgi:N-acetylglucosaminyl-diphospho-decaprenol L-rhamnosyltransferase